jgi:hypothetical protein
MTNAEFIAAVFPHPPPRERDTRSRQARRSFAPLRPPPDRLHQGIRCHILSVWRSSKHHIVWCACTASGIRSGVLGHSVRGDRVRSLGQIQPLQSATSRTDAFGNEGRSPDYDGRECVLDTFDTDPYRPMLRDIGSGICPPGHLIRTATHPSTND